MPHTPSGTVDLSQRLTDHPVLRAEIVAARDACDARQHPPGCYNPCDDSTYCECGFVQYAGDHAPSPQPRHIEPRGKFDRPV